MPDSPAPKAPYRTPWEPAQRVVHPSAYASPGELRRELLDLRQRVDAGHLGDLSPDDLALTIRQLTEARDSLRGFARPTRGVLVTVAAMFTGSGLLLAFLKMPSHAWIALGVAMVTAMVAALASEWAQRWLDAVPEYEGLIADLRKQSQAVSVSRSEQTARRGPLTQQMGTMVPQPAVVAAPPGAWTRIRAWIGAGDPVEQRNDLEDGNVREKSDERKKGQSE